MCFIRDDLISGAPCRNASRGLSRRIHVRRRTAFTRAAIGSPQPDESHLRVLKDREDGGRVLYLIKLCEVRNARIVGFQFPHQLAKEKTRLHSAVSPGEYGWIGAGSGKSGVTFNYTIGQHRGGVEPYIDRGAEEENQRIFDSLIEHRDEIEQRYGRALSWQPLEG